MSGVRLERALNLDQYLDALRGKVNRYLEDYLETRSGDRFPLLKKAMTYSLLSGGKRLRPILAMAACEAAGAEPELALPFGAAVEMIHTFSLIHDDLPAMDNDDLRRNLPTNHKIFGEAHAILAGDALLAEAFRVMADTSLYPRISAERGLAAMQEIAEASGLSGMVGGQSLDLLSENQNVGDETLHTIHLCKTARLITAATAAGGIVAGAPEDFLAVLRAYGEKIGIAFQITDDVLNEAGDAEKTGKAVGSDARHGKATYPSLHGLLESRKKAAEIAEAAAKDAMLLGDKGLRLAGIAEYIVERNR